MTRVRAWLVPLLVAGVLAGAQVRALAGEPSFRATVAPLDRATRATMVGSSWRPGCPVPLRKLRLIVMNRWRFDGEVGWGRLVVHRRLAGDVVSAFERLFDVRYPIRRMRLVDAYGADDARSMRANNTSAFNCREVTGRPGIWSQHAYGRAIDLNPVQNPYVLGSTVLPGRGRRYLDRSLDHPAMVRGGEAVVRAFRRIGWGWGGAWASPVDYMHFSSTGR